MTTNRASLARQLKEGERIAERHYWHAVKHFEQADRPDDALALRQEAYLVWSTLQALCEKFQDYNHPQGVVIRPEIDSKGPLTSRMEE